MKNDLIPLENFFAATLEETLDEWPATMARREGVEPARICDRIEVVS